MATHSRKKVSPINLAPAINEILKEYGDEAYEAINDSVDEVISMATDKLRAVNHWKEDGSGAYAGSWANKEVEKTVLTVKKAVYNEEHYRLTHLLEHGHVVRNGTGRIGSGKKDRTDAYPHIGPVNDWAQSEAVKVIKQKLGSI